jgi:ABC-type glycerol-3-phosphate transport system substrate-binding protein
MIAMTRRHLLRATGLAGLAAGVAACAGGPVPSVHGGPATIDVATNDANYLAFFRHIAETLNRDPGRYQYTVRGFVQPTDQVVTKLVTAHMIGAELPELPGLEISQFSRLRRDHIADELLVDLSSAIPGLERDFFPARLAPYTSAGRVYGLESDMCLAVYYYREDLFEKYGLPTDFDTWDDLIAIGTTAKQRHGVSVGAIGTTDIAWFAMLMLQQGGEFFGPDGELRVDGPESVTALETMVSGVRSGAFAEFPDFFGAAAASALNQDKIAGYFMPDWFLPFVLKQNAPQQSGRWRVRLLPRFPMGGPTSTWGGTGFAVPKNQPMTEPALELLTAAYATVEGQVQRFLTASFLPSIKSAWDDPRLLTYEDDFLGGQRPFDVYRKVVAEAPALVTSEYWSVMVTQFTIAISDVLLGRASPAAAITSAAASIRSQMREAG